jgi:hypothetical protein
LLTSDVASVENCLIIALDQEHDTSRAMVGIDKGHANLFNRGKFNLRRRVQWNWALNEMRNESLYPKFSKYLQAKSLDTTHQQLVEMFVGHLLCFQNPSRDIHAMGEFLKPQQ